MSRDPTASAAPSAAPGAAVVAARKRHLTLEWVLHQLRDNDPRMVALELAREEEWPLRLDDGHTMFISVHPDRVFLAAADRAFALEPMRGESLGGEFQFAYLAREVADGTGYKLATHPTGAASEYAPDVLARTYAFDDNGEMSFTTRHHVDRVKYARLYERFFDLALPDDDAPLPRDVRVLLPEGPATHVLYVHDGQNVLARDSSLPAAFQVPFGGWKLDACAPPGLMIVAVHNTAERLVDYTHTAHGDPARGGGAERYARFLLDVVRPLVAARYGEPPVRGVMGSSLGGLVSLFIADAHPDAFHFAAGLSSTLWWGGGGNTLIERYKARPVRDTVLYLDSGGNKDVICTDANGDGLYEETGTFDNYCSTVQMREVLVARGYVLGDNLHYTHDAGVTGNGAEHREEAWEYRARAIVMPLFMRLGPRA